MMIGTIINRIRTELETVFDETASWFDIDIRLLNYDPKNGGWNIFKILEHISLTNHFLLILIKKGTMKAKERSGKENYAGLLENYDINWNKLDEIGKHGSFYWNRPEHMEPTGKAGLLSIKNKLQDQKIEILGYLEQLKNGQGVLYKTTMSVNDLGKIDVYHYILFLAWHTKRHLAQMEKVKTEFEQSEIKN